MTETPETDRETWTTYFEMDKVVDAVFARKLERERDEARELSNEMQMLFDMQHKRTVKADKMWRDATGNNYLPDLGTLIDWLIERASAPVQTSGTSHDPCG